ncbi:MAG: ParA family protein [Alphaproteobacteria bacterium]|nr:ParA family protein [Alphaproteobacteria bacterium]
MAGLIITVAQQKGGAGKTTLAAHLAAYWYRKGRDIGLLDMDPQASLTQWYQVRGERDPAAVAGLPLESAEGWRARSLLDRLRRTCELVLVDSPPRVQTEARLAMRGASLVLVPMQMSPMDLWATQPTIEIAERERVPALIVGNRVPTRGRLSEAIKAKIAERKLELAHSMLGNRQIYAASLLEGLGVSEAEPKSPAAYEITMLAREIDRRLAGS